MARGIILFGSAGSGKTTLGKIIAQALGFPYFDIDDYIWRSDTPKPFSVMYSREDKRDRLMADISRGEHFVMAGSMDSFHQPFDPLFDLGVLLTAPWEVRQERLHARELRAFGERILPGGDMYADHQRFLEASMRYDSDGSPCYSVHSAWADSLPCPVLRLNGAESLEENARIILDAYWNRPDSAHEGNSTERKLCMKVYGMGICGDCIAMRKEFDEKGLEYEFVEVTESIPLMREFLTLRDTEDVFAEVRREHRIGVPCFVLPDGSLTLNISVAKAALGAE